MNVKNTSNWWSVGSLVDFFLLLNNGGMFCRDVHAKWAKKSLQVSIPIAACRRLRSSNKTNKTKKQNETLWGCQKSSWQVLVVSNSQGYDPNPPGPEWHRWRKPNGCHCVANLLHQLAWSFICLRNKKMTSYDFRQSVLKPNLYFYIFA